MIANGPYHEGELAVQALAGEQVAAEMNGRVIAPVIPKGALSFLAQQSMVVLASVDKSGQPWSSVLVGPAGFAQSLSAETVAIDLNHAPFNENDPTAENLAGGEYVGMLAIEFDRRRRLRINGTVAEKSNGQVTIDVSEAYPNCPKYIQRRHLRSLSPRPQGGRFQKAERLGDEQADWIRRTDTLFVASVHPQRGADASHRGGVPGFVTVLDSSTIRIPDYAGNSMYSTLGNLRIRPNVGVLFLDFDASRVLQLTGTAHLTFDAGDASDGGGTGRYWEMKIRQWRQWDLAVEMHWEQLEPSPHNPRV